MKIAVWHNLPSGGGKRALYDHVRGLVERGHEVEAWCPPTADQDYFPLGNLIHETIIPLDFDPGVSDNLQSIFPPKFRLIEYLKAMELHCEICAKEISTRGYDLLFANSCLAFRAPYIGRHVNLPKILYLQEPYRWLYEALPQLPWIAYPSPKGFWLSPNYLFYYLKDLLKTQLLRIQAREELLNVQAFDTVLVNSFYSRESVLRAYGLEARVCYLGVDTQKFRNYQKPREDFVLGIGAIVPEKNLEFVIKSISYLPEPKPQLVWIGNTYCQEFLSEMEALAQNLRVHFSFKLNEEDEKLVEFYNTARLVVYTPRLEPFGYVPLEANACGCPVVTVAEGGVRETVINEVNGLVVEHNPQALANAIQRLMNDQDYANRLGLNGNALVAKQWTLDCGIDRLEKRFMETLSMTETI